MLLGLGVVVIWAPASYAVTTCLGQAATWEGTEGDDTVTGTSGNDVFVGLGGNDTVDGLGGDDLFCLGDGDDVATGGDGTNHFVDGSGNDAYWGNPTEQSDVIDYSESWGGYIDLRKGDAEGDTLHDVHSAIGSPNDDHLYGDDQGDLLIGGGGDDVILGGWGNDEIHGAAGNDLLDGEAGDDIVTGDANPDVIFSGPGNDTLIGPSTVGEPSDEDYLFCTFAPGPLHISLIDHTATGEGTDVVSGFFQVDGTDYADVLTGDDGPNLLRGGKGDDVLDGAGGDDQLFGEDGYNTASFASAPNGVTATIFEATGDGNDTIEQISEVTGSPFDDTLTGPSYGLSGMGGNDTLIGTQWGENLDGGPGDDTFLPGRGGVDQITTGDGFDTVSYEDSGDGVHVDLATGLATGGGTTTFHDVPEVLTGSPYDDALTGSTNDDTINGLGGNDTVVPGEGDDQITTGPGTDTISYEDAARGVQVNLATGQATGAGTDTFLDAPEGLTGSAYDDVIVGTPAADVLAGLGGNDVFTPGAGEDHYTGGPGIDTVDFAAAPRGVTVNLVTGQASGQGLDTLSGVEDIKGSSNGDILVGNGLANVLRGGAGNDRMTGLGGADSYTGGAGFDAVDFGGAHHRVTADLTDGTAYGEGGDSLLGVEKLLGSSFSDTFLGNTLANVLRGGPGADLLDGRGGRDSLFGNNGPDLLVGGPGIDSCSGGPDTDRASTCEAKASIP